MAKKYLSVLVDNHAGVLARVSSLFCQRGFNIDSLTVQVYQIFCTLQVQISSSVQLDDICTVTPLAQKLIDRFWGGPLTLILPKILSR